MMLACGREFVTSLCDLIMHDYWFLDLMNALPGNLLELT